MDTSGRTKRKRRGRKAVEIGQPNKKSTEKKIKPKTASQIQAEKNIEKAEPDQVEMDISEEEDALSTEEQVFEALAKRKREPTKIDNMFEQLKSSKRRKINENESKLEVDEFWGDSRGNNSRICLYFVDYR